MRFNQLLSGGIVSLLLACGGGSTTQAPLKVAVTPATAALQSGQVQAFSATVDGATSSAVTWSVLESGGGAISATGSYTAPAAPGTFHVQAALDSDTSHLAQATVTVTAPPAGTPYLGIAGDLNGYLPLPADNPWNQDISALPADPASDTIIAFVGAGATLHPDFGSGTLGGASFGIPYAVVAGTQGRVPVTYLQWGDESEPGPMPIPVPPPFEGTSPSDALPGDRHVVVLDRDSHLLYELYDAQLQGDGSWHADNGAVWDLDSDGLRPYGWTSADAAGLPIFPGLAKYGEVAAGSIQHALRLTVPVTRQAFVLPATHWASSNTSASAPPMGTRFRLKASIDLSGYPAQARAVLTALKKYGLILADNGSAWFISGCPDPGWNNDDLHTLTGITGADLEVVQMGTVYTAVPAGPAPVQPTFSASPATVAPGGSTTLSWTATGATRFILSPGPGLVRGASAVVQPAATTTYTLLAEGPYGSATGQVTVTVN